MSRPSGARHATLVVELFGLLSAFATGGARAERIDVTSTTLIAGMGDPRDGKVYTVVPVYQNLQLLADELQVPYVDEVKIVARGWGGESFGSPLESVAADLDVGYIEGKVARRHIEIRIGRQFIYGGAARAQHIDGASITFRIWRGLGLSTYGGVPVVPRFGVKQGDAVVGTRLFWRWSVNGEAGASFVQVNDVGRIARQDLGVDLRWSPVRQLTLSGYGLFSLYELRLAEGDAQIAWQPRGWVDVTVDYRRTAPDLFIPRSSIFAVFSEEKRDEAGARLYLKPIPRLSLQGDYHFISNEAGYGHRGALRGTLAFGPAYQASLGLEARVLHLPNNGYVEGRAFVTYRIIQGLTLTADTDYYWYERALEGQSYSFTGAGTVGWDFAPRWRFVVAGIGDVTPQVQQRFEVIGKLVWNQQVRYREERH